MERRLLWYQTPSGRWEDGLPIGNGRLAAMVVNEADRDRIPMNHEWLWRGVSRDRDNVYAADRLPEVRSCLEKGDFRTATELANRYFAGKGGISGVKGRVDPYQTAGEIVFVPEGGCFLERSLDLDTAVAYCIRDVKCGDREGTAGESIGREGGGREGTAGESCGREDAGRGRLKCKASVSCADNFLMLRYWGEGIRFSGRLFYTRVEDGESVTRVQYTENRICFACAFEKGQSYRAEAVYASDGHIFADGDGITIKDAGYLDLFLNIGVEHKGIEEELMRYPLPAGEYDTENLFGRQEERFSGMMRRASVEISAPKVPLPADERIRRMRRGEKDNGLLLLYYHYGKYLLMCSSVCGELPANLQGKWNDLILPPWDCDYHFDINLEMNYWAAEQNDMGECAEALLQLCERFVPHARKAARDLYGCRGIYFPLQTDCWGRSTPEACGWAAWIGAAAWIAQHFWMHYRYSNDREFLRERAYPFFREVAEFYEDYLVLDGKGEYQILPSQSPENRFVGTGDFPVSIGISAAMDVQLCYDVLGYAIESAQLLGIDPQRREKWEEIRAHLPAFKIGSDGRLLEWDREVEEAEPGHRHFSHLYGLYPSDIFNPETRPAQYEAARKSLEFRLGQGGGHTGWSRAWSACLQARCNNGEAFYEHFAALVKDFATDSLLDLCGDIFQIDGNLGAVAAVNEALFGCWNGKVRLLQALPEEWRAEGRVNNVKIMGGHTLSFAWKDGKVTDLSLRKGAEEPVVLVYNGEEHIY
ncbi:MAG: alpha-L-fucosidase [Lachnospiraceae bacterium]|nr:alpha-L-fucosidase [Lachnospiraceae bacterium]